MSLQQDDTVFLSVIENNKGIIYKVANAYCKDDEDRKDLIQEIISQLWQSFSRYNDQYKFSTWMYRVALNVAISFYRSTKIRREITQPLNEGIISIVDDNEYLELEGNLSLLRQFINELKELDRALMILYLEDKNYKEMADILGISETNVATKISRIKDKLKQRFSQANQ
jgi:RNA polymerase sigma factor (sigma-70 family)